MLSGLFSIARLQELAENPFVCPNCGQQFFIKWYKLNFGRSYTVYAFGKARLKCPHCKVSDMCRQVSE